jgi:hypothetical protein
VASAKIISRDNRLNADKTVSIFLRIIHNSKAHLKLLWRIPAPLWDKKKKEVRRGYPDYIRINQDIEDKLYAAKQYLLDCKLKKITPDPVKYFTYGTVGDDLISLLHVTCPLAFLWSHLFIQILELLY